MRKISLNCLLLLAAAWLDADAKVLPGDNEDYGIFGGKPINISEVPFMAILKPTSSHLTCGASIIHEQFLLTACHCLDEHEDLFRIVVGTDDIRNGTEYEIEKMIHHPKCYLAHDSADYDLGLIKLKKKLVFGDKVQKIQLADTLPQSGEMLRTIGFGQTESADYSAKLLSVDVPFVDFETCKKMNAPGLVTDRIVCAGGLGGKGPCFGDSGSPLIYKGKILGVTSRLYSPSYDCTVKGYPDGYGSVPSMTDFINDAIKNNL